MDETSGRVKGRFRPRESLGASCRSTVESGNPATLRREVLDCGSPLPLWHRA